MQQLLESISAASMKGNLPDIKPGLTVRVYQRINEGKKERVQVFEGLVIMAKGGKGINGTFTVRRIVDGIGVEKAFPLHSPNITKIEVTKDAKVRRSKLYYMRNRSGKSARLKAKMVEGGLYIPTSGTDAGSPEQGSGESVETPIEEIVEKVAEEKE